MLLTIKPYMAEYRDRCLAIYNSNCPDYFLPEETPDFTNWLDNEIQADNAYWVCFLDNVIIGCGGIYVADEKFGRAEFPNEVGFAWGMIDADYHKQGYGKELALFRLQYLHNNYPDNPIILRTTQKTYQFFEKYGFSTYKYKHNGFGGGMHKYTMLFQ